jgi:hypothetical protein
MQHPQCKRNHLQVLATSRCRDVPRPCPHIIHNRPLQPWNQEMCALVNHLLFNTRYPVEDDGARSTLDVVNGGLHNGGADRSRDDPAEERGWKGGHGECVGAGVKMGRLVLRCSKMMDVIPDGSVLLRQHHNVIG